MSYSKLVILSVVSFKIIVSFVFLFRELYSKFVSIQLGVI